jgi:hypothetical protein
MRWKSHALAQFNGRRDMIEAKSQHTHKTDR